MKRQGIAALILLSSAAAFAAPPVVPGEGKSTLSSSQRLKAFQAAGFKLEGQRLIGCDTEPEWPQSRLQYSEVDLNGDGTPEVLIEESNAACYGNTGQAFYVLMRDPEGAWRTIANEVGVPNVLKSKRRGWADIEIGGPGLQAMPVRHWNGDEYQ